MTLATDSIASARELREKLRAAMIDLEAVISSPSSSPFWVEGVERQMARLRMALSHHISDVEGPNGIIAQIVKDAPRLEAAAEHLRADHGELTEATSRVRKALQNLGDERASDEVAALRESVLELLGMLSRHRQRGVDLVYAAYDFDIGGTG